MESRAAPQGPPLRGEVDGRRIHALPPCALSISSLAFSVYSVSPWFNSPLSLCPHGEFFLPRKWECAPGELSANEVENSLDLPARSIVLSFRYKLGVFHGKATEMAVSP